MAWKFQVPPGKMIVMVDGPLSSPGQVSVVVETPNGPRRIATFKREEDAVAFIEKYQNAQSN